MKPPIAAVGLETLIRGVFDPIVSVVESASDVATSAFDLVPGSDVLKDTAGVLSGPIKDFAEGPMRDFARTTVGETIFRAASLAVFTATYTLSPAIGPYVFPWIGPTLALASMSIPGLAQGDAFDEAVAKEAAWRAAYLANYFSKEAGDEVAKRVGPLFSEQFGRAANEVKRQLSSSFPNMPTEEALRQLRLQPSDVLDRMGLSPKALAARLNIREDVAALMIGWLRRDPSYFDKIRKWYDPQTGASIEEATYRAIEQGAFSKATAETNAILALVAANPCQAYVDAAARGRSDLLPVLRLRCQERKEQDATLTALLRVDPCAAYVEAVRLNRMDQALFRDRCSEAKASGTRQAPTAAAMISSPETPGSPSLATVVLVSALGLAIAAGAWFHFEKGS